MIRAWTFLRSIVVLVALLASACSRKDPAPPTARVSEALTVADVMGLEDPTGWSTTTAGATLTRSTVHSQGSFSLQLAPSSSNGLTPIVSVPLTKPAVIGPRLAFDIMLPTQQPNPNFFGTVQIFMDCPSRNIFNAFLAQVGLTGKPLGVFTTVDFPVANSTIAPLLNPGYTDLRFTLVVNVQVPTTGVYRLDNLRFLPAPANGCGGLPNGTFCTDNNACTTGESCQAGACTSGTAVTCTTDACHTVGACVPATGCPAPVARPNGSACNDANACTSNDRCQAGTCTGGAAVTCTTDACHTVGACVPATGCPAPVVRPNGTACNDANACTAADSCQGGTCTGTTMTCTTDSCHTVGACVPANGCPAPVAKPNGSACNDGSACTTGEACQAGICAGGSAVTCTTDACHTVGACVPATGCPAPVARPNGSACNDGSACTSSDACQSGTCTGSAVTCTTDSCHTVGACVPATGCPTPVAKANGTSCNDNDACTTAEACQGGVCSGGATVTCTTDDCHTVGACVPAGGCPAPVAKANGSGCDDDDTCTTNDHCTAGSCGGEEKTCTASDACHLPGACDPETGDCSNPSRPSSASAISGFAYDGAGRQTRDGDADLVYDGYDQLRDVVPRTTNAPKHNDGKPVQAEHHSYCYDGTRSSTTTGAGTPSAATQYWFSPDYTEREGRREHYVRLGDRLIARVSMTPPVASPQPANAVPTPPPVAANDTARARRVKWSLGLALFLSLATGLGAVALLRRRAGALRTIGRLAMVPLVGCVACESLRAGRSSDALGWNVGEILFFHQGVAAGPVLLTDSSGGVVEERRYEPFGQPIDARRGSSPPGNVDFAREPQNILNKQTDAATGWSYHGARWMAPQSARWISPDPAVKGPNPSHLTAPWDLNPYQYASQSPSALWDPDGQAPRVTPLPDTAVQIAGPPIVWQVRRLPDVPGGSQTEFRFILDVQGVPNDGSLRWEQFVGGSFTVHTLTGGVDTKHEVGELVGSKSRRFGALRDDIGGDTTPGPRPIDPNYASATNENGHYVFTDDPGAKYNFGKNNRDNEHKAIVTGVSFALEFQHKLWREGESKPFLTVQFLVVGYRDEKGVDTRRILMIPENYSGPVIEPLSSEPTPSSQ